LNQLPHLRKRRLLLDQVDQDIHSACDNLITALEAWRQDHFSDPLSPHLLFHKFKEFEAILLTTLDLLEHIRNKVLVGLVLKVPQTGADHHISSVVSQ